ncbi:MAG: hypothetical protein U0491_01085 [Candidatus Saccharimonadales bacterium]
MDANEVKKKFFDVTPPAESAPKASTKKRQLVVVDSNADAEDITPLPSEFNKTDDTTETTKVEVKREKVIQPPTLEAAPEQTPTDTKESEKVVEQPTGSAPEETAEVAKDEDGIEEPKVETIGVDPIPANEEKPAEPVEEPKPEPEDKDVPIANTFTTIDSLPDDNQKAADAVKTDTQEPRLYDTKAYHIPIKETTHGHGTKSAFVFGALFAVVFVGGLVYVLAVIAK